MVIRERQEIVVLQRDQVRQVLGHVLGDDLYAKRVASRSDATLGSAAAARPRSARSVRDSRPPAA